MITKHPETFLKLEELGRQFPRYQPTFELDKDFIRSRDAFLLNAQQNGGLIQIRTRKWFGSTIGGRLRLDDALKLYEMAYYTTGNILELGSYHGLSTMVMAHAINKSPQKKKIFTVDLQPQSVNTTNKNLRSAGLKRFVNALCGDASAIIKQFSDHNQKFQFVFIDHSHAYEPVYAVCQVLQNIIVPGGFCLFHDFNDARNRETSNNEYGVYQAVRQGLNPNAFDFYGIYGCAALYRAK
jgi:cephalosporin hydroxylase